MMTVSSKATLISREPQQCYSHVEKAMPKPHYSELVLDVTEEADGGYVAECSRENIVTQGDTWEELRANVKEATEAYFFDGSKPRAIRLHLVRDELFLMQ
jgi:predicted RNase H-like HicB family nuclease